MGTVNPNIAGSGVSSGGTNGAGSMSVVGATDFLWNPFNTSINSITLTAQGAGTVNGPDLSNAFFRGVKLVIDITVITGTGPTLTVTIQGKDPNSGKYYTILASAALAAVATTVLTVYPGMLAAANLIANDHIPSDWRVVAVVGGTGPAVTATMTAQNLL